MLFRFGDFEADSDLFELRGASGRITIEPRPLRLLLHLLVSAPTATSREELQQALWPDETVTSSSLTRAVWQLRRALAPHGEEVVATVRGRGYRIAVAVERTTSGDAPPALAARADEFVGRQDVLAAIDEAAGRMLAGEPQAILISGEPGIGKSRTIELACTSDRLAPAEVVWGRCLEGGGTAPLRPWLQVIDALIRARPIDEVLSHLGRDGAALGAVSDTIEALGVTPHRLESISEGAQQIRLLDAFLHFFSSVAADRPVVITIDDLHYSDRLSLELWKHLVHELRDCRVLLLGAYRHVAAPPNEALDDAVAATSVAPAGGPPIRLAGLTPDEVADLLERLGQPAPRAERAEAIQTRTGGNPLLVRGLAAYESATHAGGGVLPGSMVEIIEARLHGFAPETRAVLDAAAILGREFRTGVVARMAGLDIDRCLAALDEAYAAGLLTASPDGGDWRFVHMLAAEALEQALAPGQRNRLHLAAAQALDAASARTHDQAARVAHHYYRARVIADPADVLDASIHALEQAEQAFSYAEAARHCEAALEVAERIGGADEARRFDLLVRLVDLRRLLGARDERLAAGRRALERARQIGPEAIARVAIAMHDLRILAVEKEPETSAAIDEALEVTPIDASARRARLLARSAYLRSYDDRGAALARSEQAVEIARELDAGLLAEVLYIAHYLRAGPSGLEQRDAMAREIAALGARGAIDETAAIAFVETACDFLARGDAQRAAYCRGLAGAIAGRVHLPAIFWLLGAYDAGLLLLQGEEDRAERRAAEAFEIGQRADQPMAMITSAAQTMIASDQRGDPGRSADLVDLALGGSIADGGAREGELIYLASYGAYYSARAGRLERAAELFGLCLEANIEALPRDRSWLSCMTLLAHICAEVGDAEHAVMLDAILSDVELLHPIFPGPVLYTGSVPAARARLLEVRGEREAARAMYERAIAAESGIGATRAAERSRARLERLAER